MTNPFKIFKRINELEYEVNRLKYKKSRLEEIIEDKLEARDTLSNKPVYEGFVTYVVTKRSEKYLKKLADDLIKGTKK
jgi:hypothetical protein